MKCYILIKIRIVEVIKGIIYSLNPTVVLVNWKPVEMLHI